MKTIKIVLIRCPQPMLIGEETDSLYSPNRSLTPEPTLPQLAGILQKYSENFNVPMEVIQLDLRDPLNGSVEEVYYGNLILPYINETIKKMYSGINIKSLLNVIGDADIIGFTNNFAMSRRVVCDHITEIRKLFPEKEIWIGGRDVFTDRVKAVYAQAAGGDCIIFDGHVFESLPAYLNWKLHSEGNPFGITTYKDNNAVVIPGKSLIACASNKTLDIPLPIYHNPDSLGYFTGSGEGNPFSDRFVHMTISIGCPFACGYCTTGYRERYLVHKSMERIRAELDMYKKLDIRTIAIMDDNLLALGSTKVIEIMKLINLYDFQIEYGNGLMLSALMDKNWDKYAKPVFEKCLSLYAPLEDLTTDRMYDKLAPINKELALMEKIANAGFPNLKFVTMGVIFGVPGHTRENLEGNFMSNMQKFLNVFQGKELEVAMTVFNYMPLPGTKFGELALNSGRMVVNDPFYDDPEVCSFGTTSYAPEGMTHKEVFELYEKALNMNPAGKDLGLTYVQLQRLGDKALIKSGKRKIPDKWKIPGFHLRAKMKGGE